MSNIAIQKRSINAVCDEFLSLNMCSSLSPGTLKSAKKPKKHTFLSPPPKPGVNRVYNYSYRNRFMRKVLPYKLPIICRCKSGEWYLEYKFEWPDKPGKFKPIKVKDGVNRIHNLEQKEAYAKQLRDDIIFWLEVLNYNPFSQKKDIMLQAMADVERAEELNKKKDLRWTLETAIAEYSLYIEDQGYAKDTVRTYKKYIKLFQGWVFANDLQNTKAADFTEMQVQAYLEEMYDDNDKWNERTFNNYLNGTVTLFLRAIKLEKKKRVVRHLTYDFNPENLETKISHPQRNKSFTPLQVEQMKVHFAKPEYHSLRDYCEWIYLTSMRPKEIRALKTSDIDHINRQIRIKGKTGDRLIPISDQTLSLINRREILKKDINSYVFGYAGEVDIRRMSVEYFLIRFNEIAEKMNLDDNYGPYSFKPTGIIKMIMAGFKDEEIMVQTGHKTITAFAAYKRDLIIDNSHVMKGSTVDF